MSKLWANEGQRDREKPSSKRSKVLTLWDVNNLRRCSIFARRLPGTESHTHTHTHTQREGHGHTCPHIHRKFVKENNSTRPPCFYRFSDDEQIIRMRKCVRINSNFISIGNLLHALHDSVTSSSSSSGNSSWTKWTKCTDCWNKEKTYYTVHHFRTNFSHSDTRTRTVNTFYRFEGNSKELFSRKLIKFEFKNIFTEWCAWLEWKRAHAAEAK